MDFELNAREREVYDQATALSGPAASEFSPALLVEFERAGIFRLTLDGAAGRAAAVLAVEAASKAGALAPIGLHALVLPLLEPETDRIGCLVQPGEPARFGAQATIGIVYEGALARLHSLDPAAARPLTSNYVYPLGVPGSPSAAPLSQVERARVERRHRIAIGAEAVGAMAAVLAQLTAFLSQRTQFGRPIGAFQAVHHRMAQLAVLLECSRWLVREAAWLDEDAAAATAAAYAARSARRIAWEAHQLAGARGFTLDFGMHHHTLRLQLLSVEAAGAPAHAAAAGTIRWCGREEVAAAA